MVKVRCCLLEVCAFGCIRMFLLFAQTGVSELKKTLIEENSQLVQSACEGTVSYLIIFVKRFVIHSFTQASELVRKFRDNTGPSKIALPLNETDLNKKYSICFGHGICCS